MAKTYEVWVCVKEVDAGLREDVYSCVVSRAWRSQEKATAVAKIVKAAGKRAVERLDLRGDRRRTERDGVR